MILPAAGWGCLLLMFFLEPPGTARGIPVRPGEERRKSLKGQTLSIVSIHRTAFAIITGSQNSS